MTELSVTSEAEHNSATRRLPRWALPVALVAFVAALYAASQIVGVFYALIKPPAPPVPSDMNQVGYSSEIYGVDAWAYRGAVLPADVLRFYSAQGGDCLSAPFTPEQEQSLIEQYPDAGIPYASCQGEQSFSRFTLRWRVLISYYDAAIADSRLDVVRQIDWFGPVE